MSTPQWRLATSRKSPAASSGRSTRTRSRSSCSSADGERPHKKRSSSGTGYALSSSTRASASSELRSAAMRPATSRAPRSSHGSVATSTKNVSSSLSRWIGSTALPKGERISLKSSRISPPRSSSSPATLRMVAGLGASGSIRSGPRVSSGGGPSGTSGGSSSPLQNTRVRPPTSIRQQREFSIGEGLPAAPSCIIFTAMPEKQELLLVRHGQSTANAIGVWQGQMEFPLSDEGRLQAALAGRALSGTNYDAIYSSPLARAYSTAEIIAREAGFAGKVVPVRGLAERHGGVLEGRTWAEQEERNPEFARKFLSLPEEERWAMAGAETDEEILDRFERAISGIISRHPDGALMVAVSHGGVMRAFLRERFGPGVLPGNTRAANASITRIEWNDNDAGPRLVELASTKHLPEGRKPGASSVE